MLWQNHLIFNSFSNAIAMLVSDFALIVSIIYLMVVVVAVGVTFVVPIVFGLDGR